MDKTTTTAVEIYLLVDMTRPTGPLTSSQYSCRVNLANRVQVSMVFSAKAETVNATKPMAKPSGMPSEVIMAPSPSANRETGPWLSSFVKYSERLMTMTAPKAIMAKKVSINMPPNPTTLTSSSLSICFEVVPEATRE